MRYPTFCKKTKNILVCFVLRLYSIIKTKKKVEQKIRDQKLIAYLNNKLSDAESRKVESWYWASSENQKRLEQMYFTLFVGNRLHAMNQIDVEASFNDFKEKIAVRQPQPKRSFLRSFRRIAVAAVLAGIILGGGAIFLDMYNALSRPFVIVTAQGERTQAILPDGSKVWVGACSQMEYYSPKPFSKERKVNLIGEAYFEVKKDKEYAFIVNSSEQSTRVLGTKFNIRANEDDRCVITTLTEGSIQLTSSLFDEEKIIMKPQQQFRLNTQTGKAELYDCHNAEEYIEWINGVLNFRQATLKEISSDLERYYNVDITIASKALQQERFTCDFKTSDNIYQILSTLKLTNKFDYKITNRHVEIFEKNK